MGHFVPIVYLAATEQLYNWSCLSVFLCVCLSVCHYIHNILSHKNLLWHLQNVPFAFEWFGFQSISIFNYALLFSCNSFVCHTSNRAYIKKTFFFLYFINCKPLFSGKKNITFFPMSKGYLLPLDIGKKVILFFLCPKVVPFGHRKKSTFFP